MLIIFNTKPAFSISVNRTYPLPNTIALGGVPTGIMDAALAAMAIGKPSRIGSICSASANAANTGAITITCAVLLISSLRKIEMITIISISVNPPI